MPSAFVLTGTDGIKYPVSAYKRAAAADKAVWTHYEDREARIFHVAYDQADVQHETRSSVVFDRGTILEELAVTPLSIRQAQGRRIGIERPPLTIPRRWHTPRAGR
jgi:hypothetical protein